MEIGSVVMKCRSIVSGFVTFLGFSVGYCADVKQLDLKAEDVTVTSHGSGLSPYGSKPVGNGDNVDIQFDLVLGPTSTGGNPSIQEKDSKVTMYSVNSSGNRIKVTDSGFHAVSNKNKDLDGTVAAELTYQQVIGATNGDHLEFDIHLVQDPANGDQVTDITVPTNILVGKDIDCVKDTTQSLYFCRPALEDELNNTAIFPTPPNEYAMYQDDPYAYVTFDDPNASPADLCQQLTVNGTAMTLPTIDQLQSFHTFIDDNNINLEERNWSLHIANYISITKDGTGKHKAVFLGGASGGPDYSIQDNTHVIYACIVSA